MDPKVRFLPDRHDEQDAAVTAGVANGAVHAQG